VLGGATGRGAYCRERGSETLIVIFRLKIILSQGDQVKDENIIIDFDDGP